MQKTKDIERNWLKYFNYTAYSMLFLLPIAFLPSISLDYELPKVVLFRSATMMMLLFLTLDVIQKRSFTYKDLLKNLWWPRLFLFTAFSILVVWLMSSAKDLSFWGSYFRMQGLYTQMHYLLLGSLLFLGFRENRQWKTAFKSLLGGYTICLFYAVIQGLSVDPFGYNLQENSLGRVFSSMGHPNYLASLILLIVLPLISEFLLRKNRIVISLIGLSILVLLLTGSRSGFLGLLIGISIVLILKAILLKSAYSKKLLLGIFIISISTLSFVNIFENSNWVQNSFLNRLAFSKENFRSIDSRMEVWKAAVPMLEASPLFGYGPDSFQLAFSMYSPQELNALEQYNRMTDRAHNNLIQILADYGILGLVIVTCFWGLLLKDLRRSWKKLKKEEKSNAIGILAAVQAITVAHFFGFGVSAHFVVSTAYLAYLMQLLDYKTKRVKLRKSKIVWRKALVASLIFFSTSSIVVQNLLPLWSDYRAAEAFDAIIEEETNLVVSNLKEANLLHPNQDYYAYVFASVLSQIGENEAAFFYLEKAGEFNNFRDYFYYYVKAKILASNCDNATCLEANKNFAQASLLAPNYPRNWYHWGKALIDQDNCEDGLKKLYHYRDMLPEDWKQEGSEEKRLFFKHNKDFETAIAYINYCELQN